MIDIIPLPNFLLPVCINMVIVGKQAISRYMYTKNLEKD